MPLQGANGHRVLAEPNSGESGPGVVWATHAKPSFQLPHCTKGM